MKKRNIYLSMRSPEEAKDIFFSSLNSWYMKKEEEIEVEDSFQRVTSQPVFAKISVPHYHGAAMDGVAVRAEKTFSASEVNPLVLTVGKDTLWVNTGQPLPSGFDAVIMVEKLHQLDERHLEIRAPAYPWQNVRKVGEDIVASELIVPRNHLINAYDIGAFIISGNFKIRVWKRPKVLIIPTGSEILSHKKIESLQELSSKNILDSNSYLLSSLVRQNHGIPYIHEPVPDDEGLLKEIIEDALCKDFDLIVINAGSSAGTKDITSNVIKDMGEVLVHGVSIMPGKPTILGIIKGTPIVGNPGYMVSASISFELFIRPILLRFQGMEPTRKNILRAYVGRNIPSRLGIEDFIRVNVGKVGKRYILLPLSRSAGSISTLIRAEGIVRIPQDKEGLEEGEDIEVELLVDKKDVEGSVFIIGSHDISIDILKDEAKRKELPLRISSGNVGSLGGLISLKKGYSHIAGSHLLDPETGTYNVSYVQRYLRGIKVSIFNLVKRLQGLIVQKGNPKGIRGVEDLIREDISFVNRQRGAGTRILLDYKLKEHGIDPQKIRGYENEEYTHMAVAVAVKSGLADCAMGIYAASKALDLDFIPIVEEQYDLIIPSEYLDLGVIKMIIELISSDSFKERMHSLGGYDSSFSGRLWKEIDG